MLCVFCDNKTLKLQSNFGPTFPNLLRIMPEVLKKYVFFFDSRGEGVSNLLKKRKGTLNILITKYFNMMKGGTDGRL